MLAGLVAARAVDGHERAVVVEVVLDELAGRMARGGAPRRQQAHDLGGVQDAAAAGRDDPPRALVERLQRLASAARRPRRRRPRPASVKKRSTRSCTVPSCVAHPPADEDVLDAEAERARREAAHHRVDLLRGELDDRPDVEQQAVPQQPPARRPASLEAADRLERLAEHALELGQRGDPPLLVAHRRQVAHLGERDQALVLRVRARDAAEQVDVLGRRQAARGRSSAAATGAAAAPSSGAGRGGPRPRRAPRRRARNVSASIAAMPRPRAGCATATTTGAARRAPGRPPERRAAWRRARSCDGASPGRRRRGRAPRGRRAGAWRRGGRRRQRGRPTSSSST